MFKSTRSRITGGVGLLLATAMALGLAMAPAMDDETQAQQAENNGIRIGTFDPERVFQQYHGINELIALSQRLQAEAQQAQMQGNQQRLMELQMEMQEGQMRVINQFQEDVQRLVPDIARENDIKIVAVEITYIADEYGEPEDISRKLVEKLNAEAPQTEGMEGMDPFTPSQPGTSPE